MAKLRKLFTDKEVLVSIEKSKGKTGNIDYQLMSSILSSSDTGVEVSPQLCLYWAQQFDVLTKAGNNYLTLTHVNREEREKLKLRTPSRYEDKAEIELSISENKRVLIIGDIHAPYQHIDTIRFLSAIKDKYNPDTVLCVGDEADKHAMSFHDTDPNLFSASKELAMTQEVLLDIALLYPEVKICHSNHGSMSFRKANAHGIPIAYLKSYREILFPAGGGEGWDWSYSHFITLPDGSGLLVKHQPAGSVISDAAHEGVNLATGHLHGKFEITYAANSMRLYWGVQVGCLIDNDSMAFAYGKECKNKPILGVTMIINSIPTLVPMTLNTKGRWIGVIK